MLSLIIGAITGLAGPIANVIAKISDLKIAQVQASTDQERIHVDAQMSEANARLAALQAEAGSRINAIMRFLIALGPMLFLTKVFVFDKVIGSFMGHACHAGTCSVFITDPLDSNLWSVITAVLAFYFLYDIAASWRKPK